MIDKNQQWVQLLKIADTFRHNGNLYVILDINAVSTGYTNKYVIFTKNLNTNQKRTFHFFGGEVVNTS